MCCVILSGSKADNWYNDNARIAMESGDIVYAGKYSDLDYELIIGNDCELAIQSTMINHTPEVKEMLEELGIAVLVEMFGVRGKICFRKQRSSDS